MTSVGGGGASPLAAPFSLFSMQGELYFKPERRADGSVPFFRAWRHAVAIVRGRTLALYHRTGDIRQGTSDGAFALVGIVHCEQPHDYTKRDYVLRVFGEGRTQYLIQLGSLEDVQCWLDKFYDSSPAAAL